VGFQGFACKGSAFVAGKYKKEQIYRFRPGYHQGNFRYLLFGKVFHDTETAVSRALPAASRGETFVPGGGCNCHVSQ
jgi:hypothetical protein